MLSESATNRPLTMSQYQISHTITYQYDRPVLFTPHLLRLRPRCDSFQQLQKFSLSITPVPLQLYESLDLDGNMVSMACFEQVPTSNLTIQTQAQVETLLVNPFKYLLAAGALQLPIDYPTALWQQLQPYLSGYLSRSAALDPVAAQLGQEIWLATNGQTSDFLLALNQRIYHHCQYLFRETGQPLPPGITWTQQGGSCRDLAVLFMEVCRSVGLAARFVSGYQESSAEMVGDELTPPDHQQLHAWAEVYLPGAGWRGYDPTHGLAVADDHIALVASPLPQQSAPTTGAIQIGQVAQATMNYQLIIQKSVALVSG
jgi:transglutaminase-like putative cysteine protease